MKREIDDNILTHQSMRRKLLGLLGLTLLVGCDNMFGKEKKNPMIDPEHGKTIEKNRQKYRVYVVGGVRFVVPDSPYTTDADTDGRAGFHLNLAWPNIPPGSAPDTKFTQSLPDSVGNRTTNNVDVQVHERSPKLTGDGYQSYSQTALGLPSRYVFKDDLELGLRLFASKDTPNFFNNGYSLNSEVKTPYYKEAIIVEGEFIYFLYKTDIVVRIIMRGWSKINPDWKGIYLGVVETLNNYQEEGKK